jgi:hypothetical protein
MMVMRCDDVIQELGVPTGGLDPVALDDHVASCPRCIAEARRVERLDGIWEATRPEEPADFDAVWARVTDAVGAAPASRPMPGRLVALSAALVGLAAAAAVMIVTMAAFHRAGGPPAPIGPRPDIQDSVIRMEASVDPEQILFVHLDDNHPRIVHRPAPPLSETATTGADFVLLVKAGLLCDDRAEGFR